MLYLDSVFNDKNNWFMPDGCGECEEDLEWLHWESKPSRYVAGKRAIMPSKADIPQNKVLRLFPCAEIRID